MLFEYFFLFSLNLKRITESLQSRQSRSFMDLNQLLYVVVIYNHTQLNL